MPIFNVTVRVLIPAFATIEVKAKSLDAAKEKLSAEIFDDPWGSKVWENGEFEPDYSQAKDMEVID